MKNLLVRLAMILVTGCGAPAAAPPEAHDEHEETHPSEVTLSEAAITRAGITVGRATRAAIGGGAGVPAELRADPSSTAHVGAPTSGRITRVLVAIGAHVTAGEVLATIASGAAGESRATLAAARARLAASQAARDRQAALVESGVGARRGLVEAEAALAEAQAEVRALSGGLGVVGRGAGTEVRLVAPLPGIVTERHAVVGEVIDAGATLFSITDPTRLWVVGFVPELDLGIAREGAPTTLRVAAFPGARWSGRVDFVAPALDTVTRTLEIHAVLDAPDPRLRAGLFGQLEVAEGTVGETSIVIPTSALARIGGEDVVFVPAEEERTFRSLPVRLGRRDGDVVEVLEGLDERADLVTHGAFTLRSELSRGELAEHED